MRDPYVRSTKSKMEIIEMKRLLKKKARAVRTAFEIKRTQRRIHLAQWVTKNVRDSDTIQYITDTMAVGGPLRIEYLGEWRLIYPYGWKATKSGNVLLMCYKDTGEVRGYRLDRITSVGFDSETIGITGYDDQGELEDVLDTIGTPPSDSSNETRMDETDQRLPFEDELSVLNS